MDITLDWLKENDACSESRVVYNKWKGDNDAITWMRRLIKGDPVFGNLEEKERLDWGNWLIVRLLQKNNYVK